MPKQLVIRLTVSQTESYLRWRDEKVKAYALAFPDDEPPEASLHFSFGSMGADIRATMGSDSIELQEFLSDENAYVELEDV
ncbi:MAG: hypothetical protein V7744_08975 [Pseudomonadales bacterium]